MGLYKFLNIFFFCFHTILILFNVFGWLFKKLRFYNLITLSLTAFSWFVLGIWFGWGYCFCTDWHWRVRSELGYIDHTNSYVHLLLTKLTSLSFNEIIIDVITVSVFALSWGVSICLNIRDFKHGRMEG